MEPTRIFGKINQRCITWKIRNGEQSFLCVTHPHCDLIHIPIKLHEDIPNGTELWRLQECLEKNNQRGIT